MAESTRAHRPRGPVLTLLVGATLWLVAGSALAADNRVTIEDGAEEVDRGRLVAEVERAEAEGLRLSVSVLANEPSGGAIAEADRLVDQRGGAALVITPREVGGVSDVAGQDAAGAADAALERLGVDDDIVAATRAFTDHLLASQSGGVTVGPDDTIDVPGMGAISTTLIVVVVVGVVLLLLVMSVIGRLLGGGRRRYGRGRRRGIGGTVGGAAVGYGVGRRRTNRGGGSPFGGTRTSTSRSRGSTSLGRSSGSRSRGGGSRGGRSSGGGGRSRGGGKR